jgi:hypothetical protein
LALSVYPKPILPVSLKIGGLEVPLLYLGAAPQLVAASCRSTLKCRTMRHPENQPIVLTVGSCSSPLGVTVAVK